PIPSASIEAAIGVMIHSDMPAFDRVLAEIHRVLRPGGRFVHVGVHPCFIGDFADRTDPARVTIGPGYRDEGWTPAISPTEGEVGTNGQVRNKVGAAHYRLASLLNAVTEAGFGIGRVAEGGAPTPITLSLVAAKPLDGASR
ncbi:MAG: class I SAM-dependent methyltransferase, partial [Actinomycetota bacterium]